MAQTLPASTIPRTKSARDQFWLDHVRTWRTLANRLRPYAYRFATTSNESLHSGQTRETRHG